MKSNKRRGKPKTPDIIEEFIEFLFCVKGLTYRDINILTGVAVGTIHNIGKRRNFKRKDKQPQTIEDSIQVVEDTFNRSVAETHKFFKNDVEINDKNIHSHVSTQKDLLDVRKGITEASTYHKLKLAIEALADYENWCKKESPFSAKERFLLLSGLNQYREWQAQRSLKILQGFADKV